LGIPWREAGTGQIAAKTGKLTFVGELLRNPIKPV
jgi:hypothetical protein